MRSESSARPRWTDMSFSKGIERLVGSITYRASGQISKTDCIYGGGEEGEENGGGCEFHDDSRSINFLSQIGKV